MTPPKGEVEEISPGLMLWTLWNVVCTRNSGNVVALGVETTRKGHLRFVRDLN